MQQFTYTITDPLGFHARPAGELAKLAKVYGDTVITIAKGDQTVKATQLLKLMSLGIKGGEDVSVTVEGPREAQAMAAIRSFFQEKM